MFEFDEVRAILDQAVKLHEAGDFNAAVPFYIRAVTLAPNDPNVLHATGIALGQAHKPREAVKHLLAALHFGKNTADVWNALGMAFIDLRKIGNAERCFRQVVTRAPHSATGWVNFGNIAYAGGTPDIGARRFDHALSHQARFADDRFAQSMIWLLRGQWRLGWRAYEARKEIGNWRIRNRQQHHLKAKEIRRHEIKKGMTILVEAEQGQGDAVMAARFLEPFAERYGVTVIFQSHNALADLMAGALDCEVVDRTVIPKADGWVPLLSLPYFCQVSRPRDVPPPVRPFGETWQPRVPPMASVLTGCREGLRVFVHTRGNAAHSYDFDRSVPSEATLQPIADVPAIDLVRASFEEAGVGKDGTVILNEPSWRETVDQLLTCDRCLTVDTGLAHVAGSLGIPTDLMVPSMPEWRWMLGTDRTVWYPSVKLWRRTHTAAWGPMVEQIAESYAAL